MALESVLNPPSDWLLASEVDRSALLALTLFAADLLPAVWFSYHYLHKPSAPHFPQRVSSCPPKE